MMFLNLFGTWVLSGDTVDVASAVKSAKESRSPFNGGSFWSAAREKSVLYSINLGVASLPGSNTSHCSSNMDAATHSFWRASLNY